MIELPKGKPFKLPRPILTKQQELIRRMVVEENLNTKELMSKLNVTEKTLRGHLTFIYKAFDVTSKYELMYKELRNKLYENGIEL